MANASFVQGRLPFAPRVSGQIPSGSPFEGKQLDSVGRRDLKIVADMLEGRLQHYAGELRNRLASVVKEQGPSKTASAMLEILGQIEGPDDALRLQTLSGTLYARAKIEQWEGDAAGEARSLATVVRYLAVMRKLAGGDDAGGLLKYYLENIDGGTTKAASVLKEDREFNKSMWRASLAAEAGASLGRNILAEIGDLLTLEWVKVTSVARNLDSVDWSQARGVAADKARKLGLEADQVSITAGELPKKRTPAGEEMLRLAEGKTPDNLDAATVRDIKELAKGIEGQSGRRKAALLNATEEILHLIEMRELVRAGNLAGFASYVTKLQNSGEVGSRLGKKFLEDAARAAVLR